MEASSGSGSGSSDISLNNCMPLFLEILRKRGQLPECAQATLVRMLLFEDGNNGVEGDGDGDGDIDVIIDSDSDTDVGAMVRFLMRRAFRFETERLLRRHNRSAVPDPNDRRSLMEYSQTTRTNLFVALLFSFHEIPDCLWKALSENPTFRRAVSSVCDQVRQSIEAWLYTTGSTVTNLDSDRDSQDQVETVLRLFPSFLSHSHSNPNSNSNKGLSVLRAAISSNDNGYDNSKSVSFVPLLAKLGLELCADSRGVDRGGLLVYDDRDGNALRYIAGLNYHNDPNQSTAKLSTADLILIDNANRNAMIELRAQNLLFKEDIQREDLMKCCLLSLNPHQQDPEFFAAEQRFRYLVDWDPLFLARDIPQKRTDNGTLPLHRAAYNVSLLPHRLNRHYSQNNLPAAFFRVVLELGIKHFPTKLGFLFHMDQFDQTPYKMACKKWGREETHEMVRAILSASVNDGDVDRGDNGGDDRDRGDDSDRNDDVDIDVAFDDGKAVALESLVALAVDDTVHLEGVYFVLRLNPSIIARALWSGEARSGHPPKRKRRTKGDDTYYCSRRRKTDGDENTGR